MGEETNDQRLLRRHHAGHTSPKHVAKRKPQPKVASRKPISRASGDKPLLKQPPAFMPEPPAPAVREERRREPREAGDAEGRTNPVATGLEIVDHISYGLDVARDGAAHGATFAKLTEELAEESVKFGTETAGGAEMAMGGTSAALSLVNIGGGIFEMIEGAKEYKHDETEGAFSFAQGGLTTASGVTGVVGLAGVGGAAALAPLIGSAGLGAKVGHYGDKQVKEMGWLHDDSTGEAVTASAYVGQEADVVDNKVTELTGDPSLGAFAGVETVVAGSLAGGVVSAAAAGNIKLLELEGAGQHYGRYLKHQERTEQLGFDGSGHSVRDPLTGKVTGNEAGSDAARVGAQQLADYEDESDAAIEHQKLLHPERWGEVPNSVSMFNDAATHMYSATHKK